MLGGRILNYCFTDVVRRHCRGCSLVQTHVSIEREGILLGGCSHGSHAGSAGSSFQLPESQVVPWTEYHHRVLLLRNKGEAKGSRTKSGTNWHWVSIIGTDSWKEVEAAHQTLLRQLKPFIWEDTSKSSWKMELKDTFVSVKKFTCRFSLSVICHKCLEDIPSVWISVFFFFLTKFSFYLHKLSEVLSYLKFFDYFRRVLTNSEFKTEITWPFTTLDCLETRSVFIFSPRDDYKR